MQYLDLVKQYGQFFLLQDPFLLIPQYVFCVDHHVPFCYFLGEPWLISKGTFSPRYEICLEFDGYVVR